MQSFLSHRFVFLSLGIGGVAGWFGSSLSVNVLSVLCSGVGRSVRLGVDYKLLNLLLVTRDGDIKDRSDVSSFTFSFSCVSGMIPGSFTS